MVPLVLESEAALDDAANVGVVSAAVRPPQLGGIQIGAALIVGLCVAQKVAF